MNRENPRRVIEATHEAQDEELPLQGTHVGGVGHILNDTEGVDNNDGCEPHGRSGE